MFLRQHSRHVPTAASPRTRGKAAWAVLIAGAALIAPASALGAPAGRVSALAAVAPAAPAECIVHSLPSFVAQGEFATTATVADVIEVECNPLLYGTGSEVSVSASQLFSRCGGQLSWYVPNPYREQQDTPSVTLSLDADGNTTVALIAGPRCQAGESLITVHQLDEPFESFATAFTVLPPGDTPEGVTALPGEQVEDSGSSAVATIIEAEFPGKSESKVRIGSEELLSRCRNAPKLHWIKEDRSATQEVGEVNGLELDNNGNVFVIAIGDSSCYPGTSLIEADLESKPFTTLTTGFTIRPPQPTAEPSLRIEKLQEIAESGGPGFTTSPLFGVVGQTVNYEIEVTNTANVPETLSDFADPHCDPGTIAGGPGSSALAPGQSTTYTCTHVLTAPGTFINVASVIAHTVGGNPLSQVSNEVEVKAAEPSFTVQKLQKISGGTGEFTTAPLEGFVGQTVDYEVLVKNTGEVSLSLGALSDPKCDAGTIKGPGISLLGPGAETSYTCSHMLTEAGIFTNVAGVTALPPGGTSRKQESNTVEVKAIQGESAFEVGKLQRMGSGNAFTTAHLTGSVGQTIEYEIVVKNTGNEPLLLSSFSDPKCDAGTIGGGPAGMPVEPGKSTTYTCSHLITAAEPEVVNVAVVSGGAPGESPKPLESPKVVVGPEAKQEVEPFCAAKASLNGVGGPKTGAFVASVRVGQIAKITFYLDGRKLRTMTRAQAKHGRFSVKIDAGHLAHGAHRVSVKSAQTDARCPTSTVAKTFVRPFAASRAPRFTG